MGVEVKRFEVWLVDLNPTRGSEINKTRPCLVISPDEANQFLKTVTVAAITTARRTYPTRVDTVFVRNDGQVALDQLRSVDKGLVKKLGVLDTDACQRVCGTLQAMFAY